MKFYVYPNNVYTDEDFDEMCEGRDLPPGMSDDYSVVDTFDLEANACLALNNHRTPDTWRLVLMLTTPTQALEDGEDPITSRVFEVPITANGLSFIACAVVTYDHLYHTREVEWHESYAVYLANKASG
jgi:hypothetical protein